VAAVEEALILGDLDFDLPCSAPGSVESADWAIVCLKCRETVYFCEAHVRSLRQAWVIIERLRAGQNYARRCCGFVGDRLDDVVELVPLRGRS
jgi:hypothetical protein